MSVRNIAAQAGHWSAGHRKTAILGWIAFVIVSAFIGGALGTKQIGSADRGVGQSGRADKVLNTEFSTGAHEQVLIQSDTETIASPPFRRAIRDVQTRLSVLAGVAHLRSPLATGNADQISNDRHSALVTFDLRGSSETAAERVQPMLDATAAAQRASPGLRIAEFGDASAQKAFEEALGEDFAKASQLSLPITLVILIVAFGALVAAGIPVLLAITGIIATLGVVAVASQISPVDQTVSEVVLLVGMAVGVDYSLFYMRRQREERAAGRTNADALDAAAATSGHSVLISGLTVMTAMAGLYFTGDKTFASLGTGAILVVAVAIVGSLTVLPALLSVLGDRVMKGRVPFLGRRREAKHSESRVWSAVLDRVLKRPLLSATLAGGLLVALTVPAMSLHTAETDVEGLPPSLEATKTVKRIEAAFPGAPTPAMVVVQAQDTRSPAIGAAIGRLESRALATGRMKGPIAVQQSPSHRAVVVQIPLTGSGTDAASTQALDTLRSDVVPSTVGAVPGAEVSVTGMAARSTDYTNSVKAHAPLVFGFVLAMAFVLLLVTFRSIVIPINAIVLNLLSVGAAYGVLVLVFQHGWGQSLLGFTSTGAVTPWLPMFLFVILFGLSMDYHVFILSRIREAYDRGSSNEDAVARGIKNTAGVVTSAAIVMVAVFSIFAASRALDFKQLGVGLAAAILIDATVIRGVLLPATMTLLGDWNWYLPRWLGWLPRNRRSVEVPAPGVTAVGNPVPVYHQSASCSSITPNPSAKSMPLSEPEKAPNRWR